jgi:hypothetical protein
MPLSVTTIIVEKTGLLKSYTIKDYKEEELYKKCGFKKAEGFKKQTDWIIKYDGQKYIVSMYGKLDGKANTENKYDFPPPIDTKLYFGSCLLIARVKNDKNESNLVSLTIPLWEKLYEKLFGGFEDLAVAAIEDEEEEDELENIPNSKKTKIGGYLKDGFVVDDEEEEDADDEDEDDENEDEDENEPVQNTGEAEEVIELEDIGSELSEENYEYSESSESESSESESESEDEDEDEDNSESDVDGEDYDTSEDLEDEEEC